MYKYIYICIYIYMYIHMCFYVFRDWLECRLYGDLDLTPRATRPGLVRLDGLSSQDSAWRQGAARKSVQLKVILVMK